MPVRPARGVAESGGCMHSWEGWPEWHHHRLSLPACGRVGSRRGDSVLLCPDCAARWWGWRCLAASPATFSTACAVGWIVAMPGARRRGWGNGPHAPPGSALGPLAPDCFGGGVPLSLCVGGSLMFLERESLLRPRRRSILPIVYLSPFSALFHLCFSFLLCPFLFFLLHSFHLPSSLAIHT